jgi:uncharacterized protein YndB with AHSA1/START domain
MQALLILVGAIALLGMGLIGVGYMLPKGHSIARSVLLAATPEAVWALITDFAREPEWNPAVRESRRGDDRDGHEIWLTTDRRGGRLALLTAEADPPRRLVRRIADPGAFGGQWTIELAPDAAGTRLTVTEDGEVYNPVFRLVSRFMNQAATIEAYVASLDRRLSG